MALWKIIVEVDVWSDRDPNEWDLIDLSRMAFEDEVDTVVSASAQLVKEQF